MARYNERESLKKHTGQRNKTALTRVAKIGLANESNKNNEDKEKLTIIWLSRVIWCLSRPATTCMRKCLNLKSFKLRRYSITSEAPKLKRMTFELEHKSGTFRSDNVFCPVISISIKSQHPPNIANNLVWAHIRPEAPVSENVKLLLKSVTGAMKSFRVLSRL